MKCPFCHQDNDKVADTRTSDDGYVIRRRRICCHCDKRFTTYERIETISISVIKRDGHRVPFDRERLRRGLEKACWKRPISDAQLATLIAQVEGDIDSMFETEVESRFIGERAMRYLADLDQVAYVRFASVYRQFEDVSDFTQQISALQNHPEKHRASSLHSEPTKRKKLRFPKSNKKKLENSG